MHENKATVLHEVASPKGSIFPMLKGCLKKSIVYVGELKTHKDHTKPLIEEQKIFLQRMRKAKELIFNEKKKNRVFKQFKTQPKQRYIFDRKVSSIKDLEKSSPQFSDLSIQQSLQSIFSQRKKQRSSQMLQRKAQKYKQLQEISELPKCTEPFKRKTQPIDEPNTQSHEIKYLKYEESEEFSPPNQYFMKKKELNKKTKPKFGRHKMIPLFKKKVKEENFSRLNGWDNEDNQWQF